MDVDSELTEGVGALRMSLRERPRKQQSDRRLRERSEDLKFLEDFDPEKSNREKRKLKRKLTNSRSTVYDEYGHMRHNGMDICDCLDEKCPGCWFECKNCGSTRCGVQCRVNRKQFVDEITFDGKDVVIKNKFVL
ncbi:PREDICTED: ARL14 effector protein [Bactrocera latifrons]|uniref:ARL14 effector protein n=1 Tax=Bactrocera latifrons TaxID=174628 RepID=UPI0008DDEA5B|nr:PREDICTED: ARL14 effector protein [Bactrocera latifrons]